MVSRATLSTVHNQTTMAVSRASAREFDDKHLMQQVKKADVFHSETPSDFERFQPVGISAVPLKQFEEDKKKQPQQQSKDKTGGDWNHDQPKGKAVDVLMVYPGASRDHPIAGMVDDRRVRPYNAKEGDAMLYHASGTEQKAYLSDTGAYLVSNNNKSEEKNAQEKERFASLRHVNLTKQKHEIKKDEQVQDHKHEGDSVNTEVRCDKDVINFYAPDGKKVGYYTKADKKWFFDVNNAGNITLEMTDSTITLKAFGSTIVMDSGKIADTTQNITQTASNNATRTASKDITDTGNTITLNLSEEGGKPPALNLDGGGPKVMTVAGPAIHTYAKI